MDKTSLIRLIILGYIIPITLSAVVYFGFTTNYSKGVFTKQEFNQQYQSGIYRYRVLGSFLLLKTYDLVETLDLPLIEHNEGDARFYSAYFYLNSALLCLTCITLFFVLGGTHNHDFTKVDMPILLMTCLMTITQYVVVPYDVLSYFFLAASALIILNSNQSLGQTAILGLLVVLATLTRETAALILAFHLAVNYKEIFKRPSAFRLNQKQRELLVITICFALTYFGLRLALGFENAIYQNITLSVLLNRLPVLSILFFAGIVILVLITRDKQNEVNVFLLASTPYTIPLLGISVLWEIRLWVPVILLLLILKIREKTAAPASAAD